MDENDPSLRYLREKLTGRVLEFNSFRGDEVIVIPKEEMGEIFRTLREDPNLKFNFLTDLTAVDFLGKKKPRFEIVYHLYSLSNKFRLRVKIPVAEEEPIVASLTSLWKGADWLEREVWDMFGIRFLAHPDLKRILLYEEFQGHPLRKDYPVNQCQPLVPERNVEGTFVDQSSKNKLLQLKQKFSVKARRPVE
ncbi:MAG: NADH-quinone oxidoreductase subunit C [Candidatus Binatia bacterium]